MKTQLRKWGNSLAVRIPKTVAEAAKLRRGDRLEFVVPRPGSVEIRSVKQRPSLAQLVKGITPENRHGETDWGFPRGKEVW